MPRLASLRKRVTDLIPELAKFGVVGTGLGTIFRYFSYKKWVFLADTPAATVAAGEAAVSGLVDVAGTSEEEALEEEVLLEEFFRTAEASRR